MTTAADLLKKAESRGKTPHVFQPQKRRAWDYAVQEIAASEEIVQKENRNESGNNWVQKSEQSEDRNRNNRVQISEQSRDENGYVNRNNLSQETSQDKKLDASKSINKLPTLHDENIEANVLKVLRKITGHQQQIMGQITAHIKSLKEITNTINIPISTLSERINADKDITRTSIKRLQQKSILLKESGKKGRHGSTYVLVPDFIIKECLNLFDCGPLSFEETGYINRNEYRNNNSLYSSNNINTTTRNTDDLPENWLSINFEPLTDIGFSLTQLRQLCLKSLNTHEVVQESINHFAFGIENNPKFQKYSEPLNVLMGVLRKGDAWFEKNYVSPQEKAQRRLLEFKKAEGERLKALEEEAYKIALEDWKASLSVEEIEDIVPKQAKKGDITPHSVKMSAYFRENIWPLKKNDYLI